MDGGLDALSRWTISPERAPRTPGPTKIARHRSPAAAAAMNGVPVRIDGQRPAARYMLEVGQQPRRAQTTPSARNGAMAAAVIVSIAPSIRYSLSSRHVPVRRDCGTARRRSLVLGTRYETIMNRKYSTAIASAVPASAATARSIGNCSARTCTSITSMPLNTPTRPAW